MPAWLIAQANTAAALRGWTPFAAPECRIRKGGSWRSQARDLRCAARKFSPPDTADGFIGFRVLREMKLNQ
jgi:formylglycine-generating enzyme required for sulfatase activity